MPLGLGLWCRAGPGAGGDQEENGFGPQAGAVTREAAEALPPLEQRARQAWHNPSLDACSATTHFGDNCPTFPDNLCNSLKRRQNDSTLGKSREILLF